VFAAAVLLTQRIPGCPLIDPVRTLECRKDIDAPLAQRSVTAMRMALTRRSSFLSLLLSGLLLVHVTAALEEDSCNGAQAGF